MPIPTTAQLAAAREAKEAARKAKEDADYEDWKRKLAANKNGQVATPPPASVTTTTSSIAQGPQQSPTATQPTDNKPIEGTSFGMQTGLSGQLPSGEKPVSGSLQAAAVAEFKRGGQNAVSEERNTVCAEPALTFSQEAKASVLCVDPIPPQAASPAESNPATVTTEKCRHQSADDRMQSKSGSARKEREAAQSNESAPCPKAAGLTAEALLQHTTEPESATGPVYQDYRAQLSEDDIRDRLRRLSLEQLRLMVPALRDLKPGPYPLGKPHLCPPVLSLRIEGKSNKRITAHLHIPSSITMKRNPVVSFESPGRRRNRERRIGNALRLRDIVHREIIARRDASYMHETRAT